MADENKRYIKINKFSQNNYKDRADPTGDNGEFNKIKNYIPSPHKIETRKGVSEYSYNHPPTVDPACVLWLKFNGVSNYLDCVVNGADYMEPSTRYTTSALTVSSHEGTHALNCQPGGNQGNGVGKLSSQLPATFPCVVDSPTTDFLVSSWFNLRKKGQTLWGKRKNAITQMIGSLVPNSVSLTFVIRRSDGGNRTLSSGNGAFTTADNWTHVGYWYSTTLKKMGIRVYDDDSSTVVKNVSDTWVDAYIPERANWEGFAVGGGDMILTGDNYTKDATPQVFFDDFYVLNGLPATEAAILAKIDNIRDGNHYT